MTGGVCIEREWVKKTAISVVTRLNTDSPLNIDCCWRYNECGVICMIRLGCNV